MEDLTELEQGFVWPKCDVYARRAVFKSADDIKFALRYVTSWDVCVQAGGNCGVWPKALSHHFATVYTWEPDPLNFYCLERNCPEDRIVKRNAALGAESCFVRLTGDERNVGMHYVMPRQTGTIPAETIDSLGLESCGLIYLDIEGYELNALKGAENTIRRLKPIVAFENKHADRYGISPGDVEKWILDQDYRVVFNLKSDFVYQPC